jgi:hypothetical protein
MAITMVGARAPNHPNNPLDFPDRFRYGLGQLISETNVSNLWN